MYIDDAGIIDMRKKTMSNTPTPAEELPGQNDEEFTFYDEAQLVLARSSITPEQARELDAQLKPLFAKAYTTAQAIGRAEEKKETGLPIKNYYRVAQHLRKKARDMFVKSDTYAMGYYQAIKDVEQYFGLEEIIKGET